MERDVQFESTCNDSQAHGLFSVAVLHFLKNSARDALSHTYEALDQVLGRHQPERTRKEERLADGIFYNKYITKGTNSSLFHLISVDLKNPDVSLFVTPPGKEANEYITAQSVPSFLTQYAEKRFALAVNANFFSTSKLSPAYMTLIEGEVVRTTGLAISKGIKFAHPVGDRPSLCILPENNIEITNKIPENTVYAVSGNYVLLKNNEIQITKDNPDDNQLNPRTIVGLRNSQLVIGVVDGRRSRYSPGLTLTQTAEFLQELGVQDAINLDGGGSSTLAIKREGDLHILNSPAHYGLTFPRPVATHLMVTTNQL